MKKIMLGSIAVAAVLIVPALSSALTFRADRGASTNSGGITVSEGVLVVTGNQSSTVDLQSIQTGNNGHVDIVTEKDGVTTHESYDINGGGSSGGVIITPPPTDSGSGRPPRPPRS